MSAVVFATQTGGLLRVYVRNGAADGDELRQVSQTLVVHELDAHRLITLVSDLEAELGWTGQSAVVGDAKGALVAPATVATRAVGQHGSTLKGDRSRETILARLAEAAPEPLSIKQLGGEWVRYHLMKLVKAGTVVELKERYTHMGGALFALAEHAPKTGRDAPVRRRRGRAEMAAVHARIVEVLTDNPMDIPRLVKQMPDIHESTIAKSVKRLYASGQVTRESRGMLNTGTVVYAYSAAK
jgi:hypothetical protein